MTVLAIAAGHNSPGKKDATGAFIPESRAFAKLHSGRAVTFDNRAHDLVRLNETIRLLGAHDHSRAVGLFCHGFKNGLQCGARNWNVSSLARAIKAPIVALYACDTARDMDRDKADDREPGPGGAGGFASLLARALGRRGGWVDAHATAGHTTWNPYVRRFYTDDLTDDGFWIVEPGSEKWRTWAQKLEKDRSFRLSFPLMTVDEIRAAL